jgi:hypothetical protein
MQPGVGNSVPYFEHLILQKYLLAVTRPSRHSHFAVRLALNDDRGLVRRRPALEETFSSMSTPETPLDLST